jgi:hypothetical protein
MAVGAQDDLERYALPPLDERLREAARALEQWHARAGRVVRVTLERPGARSDDAPGPAELERGGALGHEHDTLGDDAAAPRPRSGQDDHGVE